MYKIFFSALSLPAIIFSEFQFEAFGRGGIGVVSINSFNESELSKDLSELKKEGTLKGLVLDLRSNDEERITQVMKVVELLSKKEGAPKKIIDMPMVVLTSQDPSSAVQVFCKAMEEKGAALIFKKDIEPISQPEAEVSTGLEKICQSQILTVWQKMISQLAENSSLRKSIDRNWQRLAEGKTDGCGSDDLERREAVNIVKDMIFLRS